MSLELAERPAAVRRRSRLLPWLRGSVVAAVIGFGTVVGATPALALSDPLVTVEKILATGVTAGVAADGVAAATPEIAAVAGPVCATGVGCVLLGVGALAVGAYLTRDSWIPWVENHLGQSTGGTTSTTSTAVTSPCATFGTPVLNAGGTQASISVTADSFVGNGDCLVQSLVTWQCKDNLGQTSGQTDMRTSGIDVWSGHPGTLYQPGCSLSGAATSTALQSVTFKAVGYNGTSYTGEGAHNNVSWSPQVLGTDPNAANYTAQVNCTRPDGTSYQVNASGVPNSDPSHVNAVLVPHCTAGDTQTGGSLSVNGQTQQTWSVPTDPTKSAYPNCVGANHCSYVIRIDGHSCTVGAYLCVDWTKHTSTNTVECDFGPYVLALSACNFLERAYEVGGTVPTKANTDGDPSTHDTSPLPDPVPSASPTGAWGTPSPNPSATAAPGIGTNPDPFGKQTAPAGNNCWAGIISWNPADWVETPVKCALQWAFVPREAVMSGDIGDFNKTWNASNWGQWGGALGTLLGSMSHGPGDSSDCNGPAWTIHLGWVPGHPADKTIYPMSACGEFAGNLAGVIRDGVSVVLVSSGALACVRLLMAGFGYEGVKGGE